jgi:peroxiredoxin
MTRTGSQHNSLICQSQASQKGKSRAKRERKKKEAPAAPVSSLSPDTPEAQNPFWCDAHGFSHSERLPDHRADCARER